LQKLEAKVAWQGRKGKGRQGKGMGGGKGKGRKKGEGARGRRKDIGMEERGGKGSSCAAKTAILSKF